MTFRISRTLAKAVAHKRFWHDPVNPTIIGYADKRGKLICGSIWSGGQHQTPLAQMHYDSPEGQWIRASAGIDFKGSISPLAWVLKNKPKEETHSLSFLVLAVGCGNPKIRENIQLYEIPVSSYSYIKNNEAARKQLTAIYEILLKSGIKPEDISYLRMKEHVNRSQFTHSNNAKRLLSAGYFKSIIKVFLYFAQDFKDMDDPEVKVKKWLEAGNDWNIK
jgi:hypothetical protein